MSQMPELSGTVTGWLKPKQPLAVWWQRNYPGLREVSRELSARVLAARTAGTADQPSDLHAAWDPAAPALPLIDGIPVDTPGLRYYHYALLGGAIDYRLRMEFTPRWGGDAARSAFTRAWAGSRGSIAHASAHLLADCAPALAQANPHLAGSLPALAELLEERAARLDELAPWDWVGPYATSQREEAWLIDYCIVLAELDNFYRSWGAGSDWTPLLSPSGYRSALYASGRPVRSNFWQSGGPTPRAPEPGVTARQATREAATRLAGELVRSWPLFAYLRRSPLPRLEEMAGVACGAGRTGGQSTLPLLRRDLAAQLALWRSNSARRAAQPRVIAANPTFAGSTRLPADGDLIVRNKDGTGTLIDFKSAKRIEPAGMLVVLRQVLTYALMDERDDYEIRRVGFYFSRYGVWAHWELEDLLNIGMGKSTTTPPRFLDSHQQALRRMLLDLRQPQALDVALPRR